ncbi:hypothetical protein BST92_06200 [Nonlabens arenilitoris]|uniref:Chromosome partitioning protein ParA n=1 Tax=Nonlabens arenilitoris TaxID=1217969 RepID=A0A2S7UEZ4_9FLAO|nr:hypothetical protein [Nonlabens arenilitoris]PQJ33161.1 hypothetical protein BST92_06200 [Nonlabens arenilitoris]
MGTQKDNRLIKILLGLAVLLLIILGTYTYRAHHKNEAITNQLSIEKTEIEKALENIEKEYLIEIEKGTAITSDLEAAKERITRLKDSVSRLEPNVAILARLRKELVKIKDEREVLAARVYVLEKENETLVRVKDSTLQVLNEEIIASTNKTTQIDNLNESMAKAATLLPTNFKAKGVIIRSSGKEIENDRARRVDDLKVCFTLPQNALAPTGVQSFYLQVINPDNNVLGLKKKQQFEDQELTYSKMVTFNYKGQELDICELVQANEDDIIKGTYRVNLYNNGIRVSSSELDLR